MEDGTKLPIQVNIVAAYLLIRLYKNIRYEKIGQQCETIIFYSGREGNKTTWRENQLLGVDTKLQREGSRFSLLLIGSYPERVAFEAFALELGLQDVHLHRAQPSEAMPAIYRSADSLLFPTLEEVWGL